MIDMDAAVAAIRTCKTRQALDDMLKRFELADTQKIIECLNICMYNPVRCFSSDIAIEDELELTKQIFLTGKWRLNEFYERMGIPAKEKPEAALA